MAEEIRLQGSIVNIYAPAPLYEYTIDVSKMRWGAELRTLLNELREWVRVTDSEYAERQIRGRRITVNVKPRRSGREKETRTVDVPTVPSRVENILGTMRTYLYSSINDLCPYVEKIDLGRKKRRIYFLPHSRINMFMDSIDLANKMVNEANKIIEDFTQSDHFIKLNRILSKHGYEPIEGIQPVTPVRFSLLPIVLDYGVIEEYIEEAYKKRIQESILEEKKQIIKSAVEKLRAEIQEITSKPEEAVLSKLIKVENLAKDIGVYRMLERHIIDLKKALDEKYEEVRRKKLEELENVSNQRLKALLKELV